ncbi:hypothetical protein [Spirosoma montaniterrae]|uniref:DUF4174 domain-containing protein n=1 Tax=Spirosoma montaniterrae TaxID=1178516 RepID=A0A1P9WX18_9BACT|nr:hypothetical protein [Spirosoma montaniterrae]AQG79926.1 hypothetical protein AWR27_11685 [Spirosoma montaniterrae]
MKPLLLLLCCALLGTGCVNMQSNVKRDAVPQFKRILVVTKSRKALDTYARSFLRVFPSNYEVCSVAVSQLAFDEKETIRKQADLCQSDVVLLVDVVHAGDALPWNPTGDGMSQLNLEMRPVNSDQPFWKAIVSMSRTLGERVPPERVARQLAKDGIISGQLPSAAQSELQALN